LEPFPIGSDPKTWEGPWVSITDQHLIAKFVCAQNTRQYNQAVNTPFGSGYLGTCLGLSASGEYADKILEGTFTPEESEELLPETHEVLRVLGTPLSLQPKTITSVITSEEFVRNYKIVKE
jgi:hypothetical protein